MIETWRWFGPDDPVTLADIRQAGATGIVSALHGVAPGIPWTIDEVAARHAAIREAGLDWCVVESIPVHEDIKTGAAGWRHLAEAWVESLAAVASAGLGTVCWNFMPVLDWTRTDLDAGTDGGARALRFDAVEAALFDIHILGRPGAAGDHPPDVVARAETRLAHIDADRLSATILAGLPGSEESWTLDGFRDRLAAYDGVGPDTLRARLHDFLSVIVPAAERLGVALALHPDDPPWPLFGLPRVVSTADDYAALFAAQPASANGMTFCAGSLGARRDADLPALFDGFADRVHFLHLRSVSREPDGSFAEAAHLAGDGDLVGLAIRIRAHERAAGRSIAMRPDHGHAFDRDRAASTRPGYPYLGRMRGLAEIRGAVAAIDRLTDGG